MVHPVKVGDAWYDVYIGRNPKYGNPKWGNPFVVGKHGTREEVIEKYRVWILSQPDLIAALPELNGKILGCHCFPLACHGEILIKMLSANQS
jgi:hypothetical protein